MAKISGYSPYPTFGWISYGRFITNYSYNQVTSIFFNGELLWERGVR